jgi:cystathionine beta-synthase
MIRAAASLLDLIGGTPLVHVSKTARGLPAQVYVKWELQNPGGSIKDRIALAMVLDAEEKGLLRPGGTIVECTAGNTGVGLAMIAAIRGYRAVFTMPEKVSQEKRDLLRAYGAEVIICPATPTRDDPNSFFSVAKRIADETPGAWSANQFGNMTNPETHYRTTGPEIWHQTDGKITALVSGLGTGGTLSGAGRYLKEQNPDILIVGADPLGSISSGGEPAPYKLEGVGQSFIPETTDLDIVDRWVRVSDAESFHMARRMAREEGMLVGGSSGLAMAAGLTIASELPEGSVVVVVLMDTGRNYLSKQFSDEWMRENGMAASPLQSHPEPPMG